MRHNDAATGKMPGVVLVADGIQRPGPDVPSAWLGILVAPHLPSRIESVAGVVGVGWTEQTLRFSAVPCGPLRLTPCIQYHESHATCWLRCAAPFGETRL
jgi:hypothetical protein